MRYVEPRGEAIAFELYEMLAFVNLLARKCTGADYQYGRPGERRHKVTFRVDTWTGQGH